MGHEFAEAKRRWANLVQPSDHGDDFGESGLPFALGLVFRSGVDVLNVLNAISPGMVFGFDGHALTGEEDDIAGFGHGVQGFEGDDVDALAVFNDELEAIAAVEQAFASLFGLFACSKCLVVGGNRRRQTDDEADEAGDWGYLADWKHAMYFFLGTRGGPL